ncbi:MAG: hypothetical protein VCD33_15275 [Alphaproteobacteria bacterium]
MAGDPRPRIARRQEDLSMRIAIIAFVALLVLGGGGYFGWQQLSAPAGEPGGVDDIPAMGSVEGQPVYVELGALTAPFVRNGKFAHYVVLIVNLEVGDQDDIDKVRAFMPRLRDAFVVDLHNLATIRNPDQGLINMRRVKSMLKKTTLEVLGPNVVHDVLVQLAQ